MRRTAEQQGKLRAREGRRRRIVFGGLGESPQGWGLEGEIWMPTQNRGRVEGLLELIFYSSVSKME